MLPSTFLGLLLFLWLITPGFLFNALAGRRRPMQVESAFHETSRVVLASVAFSSLAVAIILVLNSVVGPRAGLDLRRVLGRDAGYLKDHYLALAVSLLLQVLVACGLAALTNKLIRYRLTKQSGQEPPRLRAESAWTRPLGLKPADASTHAWVRLKGSGVELVGKVAAFGHDLTLADRELVLTSPMHMRGPDGSLQTLQWQMIILQGPDIEMVAVKYVRDGSEASPASTS